MASGVPCNILSSQLHKVGLARNAVHGAAKEKVEAGMDGADDMDDSEWYERVWELPLTYNQQCLALHLLFKSQLPQEELELLVPHDKELAVANIKAMLAKWASASRREAAGVGAEGLQTRSLNSIPTDEDAVAAAVERHSAQPSPSSSETSPTAHLRDDAASTSSVEGETDGADDMDDSEWYERVWELPLTYNQQCLALHLLFKSQLPQEELELLVPHDKELAVANIKAMLAKWASASRREAAGVGAEGLQTRSLNSIPTDEDAVAAAVERHSAQPSPSSSETSPTAHLRDDAASTSSVEGETDGADDMDDSEWYERVWELPLTYNQQCLALHLLFKSQLPQEELELLVPHDKELAVANIKAMLAKWAAKSRRKAAGSHPRASSSRRKAAGLGAEASQTRSSNDILTVENVFKALWSQFQAWYNNSAPAGTAGKQKAD